MNFPPLFTVKRKFKSPAPKDPEKIIKTEWQRLGLSAQVKSGDSVAITAGSRGICYIPEIIKSLAQLFLKAGARPFIVPAMGSHGGATADGQTAILKSLGITESSVGVPIKSSMNVRHIGTIDLDLPVYVDRNAWDADHIVIVNRIKPHTDFNGQIESGIYKMMAVGLGKHIGALSYHKAFLRAGFEKTLKSIGACILNSGKILAGFAIIENHWHQTAHIEAIPPAEFLQREKALLTLSRKWMPDLPIKKIDLLIVDEIGKNISGTGMDTNVIGRKHFIHGNPTPDAPLVTRIFVRDMTAQSKGNATGIGLADYTHLRLIDKIDFTATYNNCIAAANPRSAAIPIHFDSDKRALEAAMKTIGTDAPKEARVVWIRNTLKLETLRMSKACRTIIAGQDNLEIVCPEATIRFDPLGNLISD